MTSSRRRAPRASSPLALAICLAVASTVATVDAAAAGDPPAPRVETADGVVEGKSSAGSGVRTFLGIPFARPPVGDLRWKPPQPAEPWKGVRRAVEFGPRPMQHMVFADINTRAGSMSEDCLYLNVWAPPEAKGKRLPVLVYFYGGGFAVGDASEPRYDGESMARKGIVVVVANYRLGVFGFLAHPELTRESRDRASGDYGLLDQNAALLWARRNAAAFGGDPNRITIAGESAGSMSVSAHMASPRSRGLFAGAIAESGAMFANLEPVPLARAEAAGVEFATSAGAASLADLRAMTAAQLMDATRATPMGRFPLAIDGLFLTETPAATFAAGRQARVPLLAGWNTEELPAVALLKGQPATPDGYAAAVRRDYGAHADEVLARYPAATPEQALASATALASDLFIGHGTWRLVDAHGKTGGRPVYRYLYARARPAVAGAPAPRGAAHSAEIEYALGNLATNAVYAWTPDDYRVSETLQGFFANFVKTGNPNGPGLPAWPAWAAGAASAVMRVDVTSAPEHDATRDRHLLLDRLAAEPKR